MIVVIIFQVIKSLYFTTFLQFKFSFKFCKNLVKECIFELEPKDKIHVSLPIFIVSITPVLDLYIPYTCLFAEKNIGKYCVKVLSRRNTHRIKCIFCILGAAESNIWISYKYLCYSI